MSGAASLDGTLNISLANNFVPSLGQTFTVLSYASRTGEFSTITGQAIGNGLAFQLLYNATDLTLQVVPAASVGLSVGLEIPSVQNIDGNLLTQTT